MAFLVKNFLSCNIKFLWLVKKSKILDGQLPLGKFELCEIEHFWVSD